MIAVYLTPIIFHVDGVENPGNARFASIRTLEGIERSRRDDLEAIAYILMYFASMGNLPWIDDAQQTE